jgi:hypothetical protein
MARKDDTTPGDERLAKGLPSHNENGPHQETSDGEVVHFPSSSMPFLPTSANSR